MRTVSLFGGINNAVFPTREDVESLKVGDLAPDYAGRMLPVVSIYGCGENRNGRAFVCYYVAHGDNGGTVSDGLTEGAIHRDINITRANSAQIDAEERKLRLLFS